MILTVGKGVGMKNNNIIEINNLSFAYSAKDIGHLSQDKNQNILKIYQSILKENQLSELLVKVAVVKQHWGRLSPIILNIVH